MEKIQQLQQRAVISQKSLDTKGYRHLKSAAALMFCASLMSFVAVIAPYWNQSTELHGQNVSSKVSLWVASATAEKNGVSTHHDIKLCIGDTIGFGEEHGEHDCGKFHALRFFAITALLLSDAAGLALILVVSGWADRQADLPRKLSLLGVSLSAVVLLWNFLSVCIAGSVHLPQHRLTGAGFICLVLELLFVTAATVHAACALTRWSSKEDMPDVRVEPCTTRVVQIGRSQPDTSLDRYPTLMTTNVKMSSAREGKLVEEAKREAEAPSVAKATTAIAS